MSTGELEKTKLYVDLWKQAVDVQKHFNDIEIRIRGLALTVLTAALAAAAVAIKDRTATMVFGGEVQLATIVLVFGAVVWYIFYFVDQVWYHRLLMGSVKQGEFLEQKIAEFLPLDGPNKDVGLTKQISISSPYEFTLPKGKLRSLHSKAKLSIFYYSILALLLIFAALSQISAEQSSPQCPGKVTISSSSSEPVAVPTDCQ